jgi:glycosyltransferase involved in cell wall biosynthesis
MAPPPIRAAFVSHHPHLRMGGQRSMALLIEHLDRAVVEPLAICPGPGELTDHLQALGCPVVHIPLHHIKPRTLLAVWKSSRQVRALLRERAIDIIAPDAPRDALTCGLAKLGTPAKMIWFVRLTGGHNLDPILERLADGMIGVSDATRLRFSTSRRVSARYRTIFDGVDLRQFQPAEDRAALRRALDLPVDRFVLLFVGQVKEGKGVLDIVDAMPQIVAAQPSEYRPLLLVIGTPTPAAILDEIARRARAHNFASDVRVLPQQSGIERWLQAADVLVSGSHQDTEGLSRVLFEAMACGTVPVATDIRGNRDALSPESGILVPERAPAAIARAVVDLMGATAERLAAMRAAGVRRARETFDIRLHARGVEAFYRDILALAPPHERAELPPQGGGR